MSAQPLPAILDIEASGFGSASYPIEIGFVLPDGSSYCSLILPAADWSHWDHSAEKVHQVSRETLLRHGKAALEVARQLNDRLHGQTLYCDAWYHDFIWLSRLYDEAGSSPAFRLQDLRLLLSETQMEHWDLTRRAIEAELALPRHRASSDARILQATLARVRELYPRKAA